jgi:hypothetical protein
MRARKAGADGEKHRAVKPAHAKPRAAAKAAPAQSHGVAHEETAKAVVPKKAVVPPVTASPAGSAVVHRPEPTVTPPPPSPAPRGTPPPLPAPIASFIF